MRDTPSATTVRFRSMIMRRSPAERLRMGCSMFDASKRIVESAIRNQNPKITSQEAKVEIFLRFYGMEFGKPEKKKILSNLRNSDDTRYHLGD